MTMIFKTAAAAIAMLVAIPASATVTYTLTTTSSTGNSPIGGFVFESPDFITAFNYPTPGTLISCYVNAPYVCDTDMEFAPDYSGYALIGFHFSETPFGPGSFAYYFDSGSFGAFGTYNSVLIGPMQAGVLVVSDSSAAVPEPAMLGLFGMGAIALGLTRRRRA